MNIMIISYTEFNIHTHVSVTYCFHHRPRGLCPPGGQDTQPVRLPFIVPCAQHATGLSYS